ncbi:response regulator transcription factor [Paenibacillus terrigena]|uniref:response regulator transcription factor n=1 Tax=Paenibacillus terrigena TaxID=369333 RepID=UPI000374100E|nr:response regulator [Paenibacillus terrigena]
MNVLLVDDDYFVVSALEQKIDWKSLGIENIYTANNVAQAREIFKKHAVQILISDIEMPQGSGLELLAWIRGENYSVQAIFLTNYADFNYAQKAIELQSFEYFLKPIEFDKLMLIIQKAVTRAKEDKQNEKSIQEGTLWQKNQPKIVEHFWRKLINSSTSYPMKSSAILNFIEDNNLSYQPFDIFQPLLFNIFPYAGSMGKEEKGLFDYALINVMHELFQSPYFSIETLLEYKEYNWIVIFKWDHSPDSQMLEELCSSFILKANPYLKCDVCCNVGLSRGLEGISLIIKQLLTMNEEMTKSRNQTFFVEYYHQNQVGYIPPNLAHLEELLNQNKSTAFLQETTQYLSDMLYRNTLGTSSLSLFRLDMVQLVYSFLKNKGIQAHKLYTGKTNDQLFMHSLYSIEDMEEYLTYLVNTAMEYRNFAEQPKSVVDEIKQYIHSHYGDDLTRNNLAEIVYLHPDYLARLFKKETGISLGNYVIQVRISAAKHLLKTTHLPLFTITTKVGYSNYSYFSKLFKEDVGCTPNEYKKDFTDIK